MKLYAIQYKEGTANFGSIVWMNEEQMKTWSTKGYELLGTIEVTEPGTHKASEIEWSDGNIEYRRMSNRHDNTYNSGFRSAERIFAPKKTVTKEAEDRGPTGEGDRTGYIERFFIPANAKNIHCTYEVEE